MNVTKAKEFLGNHLIISDDENDSMIPMIKSIFFFYLIFSKMSVSTKK